MWQLHLARLVRTCEKLSISFDAGLPQKEVSRFLQESDSQESILNIMLTQGIGGRGYKADSSSSTNRLLQLFHCNGASQEKIKDGFSVFLSQHRLSDNPYLAGLKHLNRLKQVLVDSAIAQGYDEAIMKALA